MALATLRTPFANWFDAELRRKGVSRSQAAAFIGTRPQTISAWFTHDAQPSPDICRKIAEYLKIPVEEVLRHAGHLPPIAAAATGSVRVVVPHWLVEVLKELDEHELRVVEATAQGLLRLREERAQSEEAQ